MLFLSYIALLYNAYYFYKPTAESCIIAIIINLLAVIAYAIKWYDERAGDPDYYPGIIMHILIVFPVLYSIGLYNIKINNYQFNILSKLSIVFIIIYFFVEKHIYNTGVKLSNLIF